MDTALAARLDCVLQSTDLLEKQVATMEAQAAEKFAGRRAVASRQELVLQKLELLERTVSGMEAKFSRALAAHAESKPKSCPPARVGAEAGKVPTKIDGAEEWHAASCEGRVEAHALQRKVTTGRFIRVPSVGPRAIICRGAVQRVAACGACYCN